MLARWPHECNMYGHTSAMTRTLLRWSMPNVRNGVYRTSYIGLAIEMVANAQCSMSLYSKQPIELHAYQSQYKFNINHIRCKLMTGTTRPPHGHDWCPLQSQWQAYCGSCGSTSGEIQKYTTDWYHDTLCLLSGCADTPANLTARLNEWPLVSSWRN